ncbi:MAG: hypothetical protein M1823_000210 [Watsoniomyces obsoletus]|nr:MAG: hypothetical protein M1823_000210 [Watsoniomyces obsoletus]
MSRSANDATRFTPTGPHAHSKSSFRSPKPAPRAAPSSSSLKGETPLEKVARLREAARRAQAQRLSRFDRAILVGRVWADRAHRGVVGFLIISTVLCGVYAVVAVSDMMLYNRRKRNEWHQAKLENYYRTLAEAREAEKLGTPTEEHLAILKKEATIVEAEEAAKNKKGVFKRAKELMFSGLKKEEDPDAVASAFTGETSGILKAVEDARRENTALEEAMAAQSAPQSPPGGMLDRLGGDTAGAKAVGRISDWLTGWGSGRKTS